jgi:hypothetical protein
MQSWRSDRQYIRPDLRGSWQASKHCRRSTRVRLPARASSAVDLAARFQMTLSVAVRKVGSSHCCAAPPGARPTMRRPSRLTQTSAWPPSRCGSGGVSKSPVALSHSRTWWSSSVTTSRPSGANVARRTKVECRMAGAMGLPVPASQTRARVSEAALTRRVLSGLKARLSEARRQPPANRIGSFLSRAPELATP